MITVSQVVTDIIRTTPFLEEALQKNMINLSGFARLYRKEIEKRAKKPVKTGAIIMAVGRISKKKTLTAAAEKIFDRPREIIARSHLFELTLKHTASLSLIKKLSLLKKEDDNYFLTITQGIFESTIIASTDLKEKILKNIEKANVVSEIDNLCSVTVRLGENNVYTPGVYYMILKQLAWENINIIEVVSTTNEITIVLGQNDVEKAFALLKNLYSA